MTEPQLHHYTLLLTPSDAQVRALGELATHVAAVRRACVRQAQDGHRHALSALLGGADHLGRGDAEEAAAIAALPAFAGVPVGVIAYAVTGQRSAIARGQQAVAAPVPVAGDALITPATATGVAVAGVPGVVAADTARLPRWARQVWTATVGRAAPTLPVVGAAVTGWGYVEHDGQTWLLDVAVRWDAYPEGLLAPRWEDAEELTPARRQVLELLE